MKNKHILALIITFSIVLVACIIYFAPKLFLDKEMQKIAKVKSNNAIFTARIIEEFSINKKFNSSEAAKKIADELNKTTKNPYDKNKQAYTFEKKCTNCNNIEVDDNSQTIILTSYNNKGELIARTVIKPPSFVTYTKFD